MPRPRAPWWLFVLGGSFLAFFIFSTYCKFWQPGLGFQYSGRGVVLQVLQKVHPDSPAAKAGLQSGDRIALVDGQPVHTYLDWVAIRQNVGINRPLQLEIEREGKKLQVALYLNQRLWSYSSITNRVSMLELEGVQLLILLLAFVIAFSRPRDRVALLGAWFLATVATSYVTWPIGMGAVWRQLPAPLGALLWIPFTNRALFGAVFFTFFANFPRKLFRARWAWALVWSPTLLILSVVIPLMYRVVYHAGHSTGGYSDGANQASFLLVAGYVAAGLVALIVNYRNLEDVNERRRVQVILVGSTISFLAVLPLIVRPGIAGNFYLSPRYEMVAVFLFLAFPLSFAYAILHHRLFDIRLMIRQGLQYALARGLLLSLVPGLAVILLADLALHSDQPLIAILRARGWVYGVVGGLAVLAYLRRKHWLEALDQRFFREHYDGQRLLREVVEEAREAGSFDRIAPRVVARIEAALHPEFVALLVRDPRESAFRSVAAAPAGQAPPPLRAESKLVSLIRVLGKPLDVSSAESGWLSQQLPHEETDFVRQVRIELLIPVALSSEHREALLTLGFKRSEEPYSQEDRDILMASAASLALLLERSAKTPMPVSSAFEECPQCGACYDTGSAHCAQEGASLAPVALPRALAGRYQLNRRLGRGGMGTVYEALDTALDRRVAVKLIRDDLTGSAVAAERFQQEARVAASFAHPNVVTIHDFGVAAHTRAFLVMELLEGATLREELRRQARFTASHTVEILGRVCAAVDAAHRRQLIHRDLKPENVFLARADTNETPKVLDFGLAKFLAASSQQTLDTDTGMVIGTLRYMAPEQLRGQSVEPAWDLWALAVMAYEMLTGAHPFPGSTAAECYSAILAGSFTSVSKHLPESPGRWQDFFVEVFALDPQRRPGTARMFLSQLERALS